MFELIFWRMLTTAGSTLIIWGMIHKEIATAVSVMCLFGLILTFQEFLIDQYRKYRHRKKVEHELQKISKRTERDAACG